MSTEKSCTLLAFNTSFSSSDWCTKVEFEEDVVVGGGVGAEGGLEDFGIAPRSFDTGVDDTEAYVFSCR